MTDTQYNFGTVTPLSSSVNSSKEATVNTHDINVLMGGRAAEEIFCGDITNGASNDIEKASDIARSYINIYGFGNDNKFLKTIDNNPYKNDISNFVKDKCFERINTNWSLKGTILQKAYFVNTFCLSKLNYISQAFIMDTNILEEITKLALKFK